MFCLLRNVLPPCDLEKYLQIMSSKYLRNVLKKISEMSCLPTEMSCLLVTSEKSWLIKYCISSRPWPWEMSCLLAGTKEYRQKQRVCTYVVYLNTRGVLSWCDSLRRGYGERPTLSIDWCCFYYFVRNSLVALLEALRARIFMFRSVSIGFF